MIGLGIGLGPAGCPKKQPVGDGLIYGGTPGNYLVAEDGTFDAGPGMLVAFGADTRWVEKHLIGLQTCNGSTFDGADPAPFTYKSCVVGPWDGS